MATARRDRRIPPVQPEPQLSEDTVFGFLESSGLPLGNRLAVLVRGLSFVLALACLTLGAVRLGAGVWGDAGSPVGWLLVAPVFLFAWRQARGGRLRSAGLLLFFGGLAASALASWPHGAFYPGWYVLPFLALLATFCLGVVPGLSFALGAAVVLAASLAAAQPLPLVDLEHEVWLHTASLMALTLASSLVGVLAHKALAASLSSSEAWRRRSQEHERALRRREKLLRHALRVETIGDLAGLVSHQLRNAFQVMMGQVTLSSTEGPEQAQRRLQLVGDALAQTRPLLDQLMQLAHPDDGAVETGDANEWMAGFADSARRVLPAAIAVEFEPSTSPLPVRLDPRGLEHALWNLTINARHAMGESGVLRLGAQASGDGAVLSVADTGCGMPPEVQARIFDPYFTTKPVGQGTGLGLAAVERFVRSSQGRIEVHSQPGQGTRFSLCFPLAAGAPAATA